MSGWKYLQPRAFYIYEKVCRNVKVCRVRNKPGLLYKLWASIWVSENTNQIMKWIDGLYWSRPLNFKVYIFLLLIFRQGWLGVEPLRAKVVPDLSWLHCKKFSSSLKPIVAVRHEEDELFIVKKLSWTTSSSYDSSSFIVLSL